MAVGGLHELTPFDPLSRGDLTTDSGRGVASQLAELFNADKVDRECSHSSNPGFTYDLAPITLPPAPVGGASNG